MFDDHPEFAADRAGSDRSASCLEWTAGAYPTRHALRRIAATVVCSTHRLVFCTGEQALL
jgi:hypothetical protein